MLTNRVILYLKNKTMIKKNDIIELEITDYTDKGFGIGRYEGIAVFVPLSAIGDKLKVRIVKLKKSYAYGKIEEILSPSKDRVEPDCPVFSKCGGCTFRHISYESELKYKENAVYNCIKRIGGIDLAPNPIKSLSPNFYRNKAQYPINEEKQAGFYSTHSHRIIPCNSCLLQPKSFETAVKVFENWLKENNISVYNEEAHKGLIKHFYLRSAASGDIMAVVVINGDSLPFADRLINGLKSALGDNFKSLQINKNKQKTNVVLGKECSVLYGDNSLSDTLCGVKVNISPLSFYQVNHDMAEILYKTAKEYAKPQDKIILDLYCGAGTIGLSMANEAKQVIGVEIIPEAVEDAKRNAKNGGFSNTEFICADAKAAAKELKAKGLLPDVVIVDPPRKGCDEALIETVANDFSPERIVYVSCDAATLARDIKLFTELGYTLKEYTPCDLFPRTSHCECCALLTK